MASSKSPGQIWLRPVGTNGPPLGKLAPSGLSAAAPDVPAHIGTARRASASGTSNSSAVHAVTSAGAAPQFPDGPPLGKLAPSGGSAVHAVTSVGAISP